MLGVVMVLNCYIFQGIARGMTSNLFTERIVVFLEDGVNLPKFSNDI